MSSRSSRQKIQASPATPAGPLVLSFAELDRSSLPLAGGKAANLGELTRAGFQVPPGFCVTTAAYDAAVAGAGLEPLLAALSAAPPAALARHAAELREAIVRTPVPSAVEAAIRTAYAELAGEGAARVAVRSSATAEDLPEASFAGQQDTYLNIAGADAVVEAVRRCWSSLWTERAVAYRGANAIDHRAVKLAVVVQSMVDATISGVLFTANPLTNRRGEASIDAVAGLGEALVSGQVNPEHIVVQRASLTLSRRDAPGQVSAHQPSGAPDSSTPAQAEPPTARLSDEQARRLAQLGGQIEAHYGLPQDIEWSYDQDGQLWVLQSRPITTLFPLPDKAALHGDALRVYFCASLAQGVLQPLTPMGQEIFRQLGVGGAQLLGLPADPVCGPVVIASAAERLFLDITPMVKSALGRRALAGALEHMEPRTGEALRSLFADPRLEAAQPASRLALARRLLPLVLRTRLPLRVLRAFLWPAAARRTADRQIQRQLARYARIPDSPVEALALVEYLPRQFPRQIFPQIVPPAMITGVGSFALMRRLAGPVGEERLQRLTRGLPHNVTTEMNLKLWAASQRLRADSASSRLLREQAPAALAERYQARQLPHPLQREVEAFLHEYGFRGVAEIDVGVPRWEDAPGHIFGMLANYLQLEPGEQAPDRQFARAAAEAAETMEQIIAEAARSGLRGRLRAWLLRQLWLRIRELMGTRESPKFYAVAIMGQCRRLLLSVGERLAGAGRIAQREDILFLTLAEARAALAGADQRQLVAERRALHAREGKRKRLPRLLLSDGTTLYGEPPPGTLAPGALSGTPASPGSYTGIARVILDPDGAQLNPGEILVAPSTDPGWTPLFMTAGALVMEMGGMMSHGSVVAREYGIPAVVGVLGATGAIQTGQRISVDGERGIVTPQGDV